MEVENLISVTTEGLLLCLYVSLPVVLVSAVTGLLVAFVQGITAMQEAMLAHLIKLLAVTVTIALGAAAGGIAILRFAENLLMRVVPS
ncbi:Type III secretion inner membrane protein (YscS,homologous to flagellar export components) [plant metagenome]|uniref:Type III secretion inner membrane protein (YscS,homologous to flagellar export components) n=1 Tax=plant metagenome TaxID=1297885 RepID=A0A484VIE4_9ZZZZ